jgi:hypothetical protein
MGKNSFAKCSHGGIAGIVPPSLKTHMLKSEHARLWWLMPEILASGG